MARDMTIAENLALVESRILVACERAGRTPGSVRLLPVTKTRPASVVLEAYAAGYRRFGENRVQEASEKASGLAFLEDVSWAIIGHLQTNKASELVRFASEFQALDSVKVADALQRRLKASGRRLDVLIEVNTSGEASKFGVAPDDVGALARALTPFDALDVRGLMTIAANTPDRAVVAGCFDRLAGLREQLRDAHGGGYDELSMGMSGDYELAVEHGATCVRVGTAIFGVRV